MASLEPRPPARCKLCSARLDLMQFVVSMPDGPHLEPLCRGCYDRLCIAVRNRARTIQEEHGVNPD